MEYDMGVEEGAYADAGAGRELHQSWRRQWLGGGGAMVGMAGSGSGEDQARLCTRESSRISRREGTDAVGSALPGRDARQAARGRSAP